MTSAFNSKTTEAENKIPDVKNLASKTEVTAVENKTPTISNLVLKTDYAAEITKIKNDYVTNASNPSNCECECDKSCDIGEYLDYKKL